MGSGIKISVVILSFNRRDDIKESLSRILASGFLGLEVVVADNGSTDGTVEMIERQFPQVELIKIKENLGVAGYNLGFSKAQGKYLVILDDDSFPINDAFERIYEEFEKDPKLGIIALNVRNYYDYNQKLEEIGSKEPLKLSKRTQLAFNGAGAAMRRAVYKEVGGYPDEFFLYWNEQDLALRVLHAGYRINWYADIISLHKYSPKNRKSYRAAFYYTRNLFWLIWKHFYFKKCLADSLKVLYLTFYHSLEQRTLIYLKAFFNALFNIRKIKRKALSREIVKNLRLSYKIPFIYL